MNWRSGRVEDDKGVAYAYPKMSRNDVERLSLPMKQHDSIPGRKNLLKANIVIENMNFIIQSYFREGVISSAKLVISKGEFDKLLCNDSNLECISYDLI